MGPGGPKSMYTPRNLVFGLSNHVFTGKPVFGNWPRNPAFGGLHPCFYQIPVIDKDYNCIFFFFTLYVVAIYNFMWLPETFEKTFIPLH